MGYDNGWFVVYDCLYFRTQLIKNLPFRFLNFRGSEYNDHGILSFDAVELLQIYPCVKELTASITRIELICSSPTLIYFYRLHMPK
jgi:hypothetical protein